MKKTAFFGVLLAVCLLQGCSRSGAVAGNQMAVQWPTGTVTIYIPARAGGGTDVAGRILATALQEKTGKNFVIVNQDAGGGVVAFESCRTAKADGSALMLWHTGIFVNYYTGTYDYNPNKDFTPIGTIFGGGTQAFVVRKEFPWNSIDDLVAAAKVNPGSITYGCQEGGSAHLVAGILMDSTGITLRIVDAASQTDKITGVMGGHIDVTAITTDAAKQYETAGNLKVIGLVDADPDVNFPEYIPATQQGYANLSWSQPLVLFAPPGMDPALIKIIEDVLRSIADNKTMNEQAANMNMKFMFTSQADSVAEFAKTDKQVEDVAKSIGISVR